MAFRSLPACVLPSMITICVFLPTRGMAQTPVAACSSGDCPGPIGVGSYERKHHGPYQKPPPFWMYHDLPGGPYITTDYPLSGYPGYRGSFGSFFTNGFGHHTPKVPVYAPLPEFTPNPNLVRHSQTRKHIGLGFNYTGWIGTFRDSPRPKPPSVSPRSLLGAGAGGGMVASGPVAGGECLYVAVTVPHPAAEVFVDGVKTAQTGTDRRFESPPLEAGREAQYELVARWVEGGTTFERKKVVTGKPGEAVRVDFTTPDTLTTTASQG